MGPQGSQREIRLLSGRQDQLKACWSMRDEPVDTLAGWAVREQVEVVQDQGDPTWSSSAFTNRGSSTPMTSGAPSAGIDTDSPRAGQARRSASTR